MPSNFKYITNDKFTRTTQPLYESIPLSGSIISGTVGASTYADTNIKNYSHGRFQSVFDYPILSSSANQIVDISVGYSVDSSMSSSNSIDNAIKIAQYNLHAQVLMGYDVTGTIQKFDADGNIVAGGTKYKECIFLDFSRTVVKDGIKRGSFSIQFLTGNTFLNPHGLLTITDAHATGTYFANSAVGEWSYLSGVADIPNGGGGVCGAIFYGAGVVVLSGSIFTGTGNTVFHSSTQTFGKSFQQTLTGTSISSSANAIRRRWHNCSFNNVTELNSQFIFLDLGPNEFNYSSNPTYLSASKIRVKDEATDPPIAYITEVGFYSADNECIAVGKLSTPIKKTPSTALTLKARLDF